MFEIHQRKKGFIRLKDVYYASEIDRNNHEYDAVYYFYCREPYHPCIEHVGSMIDLSPDEEAILQSFRQSTRREIRRILEDDNFHITVVESPGQEEIETFLKEYDQFIIQKGYHPANHERIMELHHNRRLSLVNAYYGDELLLQDLTVEDTEKTVGWHSYSIRLQESDKEKLKLISRINKAAKYISMCYWKEKGKAYFDLGGLTLNDKDTSGSKVDHYKEGFHGEHVHEYEFIYPITWKGHLFCTVKKWQGALKKKKADQKNRMKVLVRLLTKSGGYAAKKEPKE